MRRLWWVAAVVALAGPVLAEDGGRVAVFGGYSYLNAGKDSLHGFEVALSYDVVGQVAFVVDGSGHYGSGLGADVTRYLATGGPAASFLRGKPASVFVHALFGVARRVDSIGVLGVTISETRNQLGMLFGGGADLRLGKKLAARVQAAYVRVQGDDGETGYRVSVGVVYRFGAK